MEIGEFQELMRRTYLERDHRRGKDGTFRWLTEEVGELARALRLEEREQIREELADVLAWLSSLANLVGIELEEAAERYDRGCPKCGESPCTCVFRP